MMASKQLLLLRHAKSDWNTNAAGDFERPLSARGRRDAPRMGRWLAQNNRQPDCIIASPSARTTETVELLCADFNAADILYERRLYHGGAAQIRAIAAEQLRRFERVLIVAHNPGMEMALLSYCPHAAPFADGKLMPTCALAVIEFAGDTANTGEGGKLRELVRPSEM